jgi:hypothetical protein
MDASLMAKPSAGEFVIASCDASTLLNFVEEPLDKVPMARYHLKMLA